MTRAIFWDNDGVLVDTESLYFEAARDTLAEIDVDLTEDQYVELFMTQGTGAVHLATAAGLSLADVETLQERINATYCARLAGDPVLVPGIVDVLRALHGKYVMGIVSSAYPEHFRLVHEKTGILEYFDFVLVGGDYPRFKPHPDPYLRAIERSGVPAAQCLAIEDSARGLRSATRAGIRCIVVPNALTRRCEFDGAFAVTEDVTEVLHLL